MPQSNNETGPTLIVADRHTLLAEAVANAARRGGYSTVEVAHDLKGIFKILNTGWKPSAVLVDLALVVDNDFEALAELDLRAGCAPIVVMLRDVDIEDGPLMIQAFVRGALGLVSKDRGVDSLMRVLDVVRLGEAAIPRAIARQVVEALRLGPVLASKDAGLSPRQRQVLALVARGLTDRQIADQLQIGLPTVRSHLENIFEKTQTQNRTAAARWAGINLTAPNPSMQGGD